MAKADRIALMSRSARAKQKNQLNSEQIQKSTLIVGFTVFVHSGGGGSPRHPSGAGNVSLSCWAIELAADGLG